MILPAQDALTPEGNPVAAPMPVAPVVVWVMFVITVLTHKVGVVDGGVTVLFDTTFTCTVAVPTTVAPFINSTLYKVLNVGDAVMVSLLGKLPGLHA